MGNICRSPIAEGVLRNRVADAGLERRVLVDSAATHGAHIGRPPDPRSQAAAILRGYDLGKLRARQLTPKDFVEFDYILAMDAENLQELRRVAPPEHRHLPRLFLDYGSKYKGAEIIDPYYGGPEGFERVLDMSEDAAIGLLDDIKKKLGL
jgi:protein-tyrosine phosphatase